MLVCLLEAPGNTIIVCSLETLNNGNTILVCSLEALGNVL